MKYFVVASLLTLSLALISAAQQPRAVTAGFSTSAQRHSHHHKHHHGKKHTGKHHGHSHSADGSFSKPY